MMKGCMGWRSTITIWSCVFLLLGFAGEFALAKELPEKKAVTLESVTVTAQKQEETAQETPVSLTVLSGMDLDYKMINSVEDLVDHVPNMSTFNTTVLGENVITMRGITATAATRNTAVGMYIDGVPVLSSFGYTSSLMDVERVEVLRGPQGTLYGKSTQAGVVSIVTKKPGNTFKGKLMLEGGKQLASQVSDQFNGNLRGAVSGPVVKDTLFFSLAGKAEHQDGFIENITTGKPEYERMGLYGDAKLRWTPTEKWDVTVSFSGESLSSDGSSANQSGKKNRIVESDLRGYQDSKIDMETLSVGYRFTDDLKLTSVTSRRSSKLEGELDFDFSPARYAHGAVDSKKTAYTQEFRLNGTFGDWDWLAGIYLDTDTLDYNAVVDSIIPAMRNRTTTKLQGNSCAGYVHLGYDITTKLKILGGARYEYQKLKFDSLALAEQQSKSWTNISPKIGLQYQIIPESMVYATVSQGYRPGGFNDRATAAEYYSYDPETMWAYEVGLKNSLLDNRLQVNVALFYMDISDKQVEENVNLTTYYLTNGAKASSMGAELDFVALVAPGLTIDGGFGYTEAKFDEFSDVNGDYSGKKLPYAPQYTYTLGVQYRTGKGWYVGADLMGYGKTYFDKKNIGYRDGYALVNCKLGYETEHYDVYLYGKNIFDVEHDVKNWNGMDVYSEPGQIGLQAVVRF